MSDLIRAENLGYTYNPGMPNSFPAISGIDISVSDGDFIAVIGHTGSGKSTLIQHFNGLLKPQDGRILLDGKDIWGKDSDIRDVRFKVGVVFQYPEYQLFEETVYKDISYGPRNMGLDEDEIRARVMEAARFVGVESLLDRSPFELSGGQKRRVAIAGIIAMEPSVLILDEPAAGLDPIGRAEIFREIKNYHRQKKNTVIIVSHSMEDVAKYAERVIVINKGSIFCDGSVEEVFGRADDLKEIGLSIPAVTSILLELKKKYPSINTACYDEASAALSIKNAIAGEAENA